MDLLDPHAAGPPSIKTMGLHLLPDVSLSMNADVRSSVFQRTGVHRKHTFSGIVGHHAAVVQPDHTLSHTPNKPEIVRYEDESSFAGAILVKPVDALPLEGGVTYGQDFIDQQDVGLNCTYDAERKPRDHAGRIPLHGRIDKFEIEFREVHRAIGEAGHRLPPYSKHCTQQVCILAARQLGMETDQHI
jgi:hypothetical protein